MRVYSSRREINNNNNSDGDRLIDLAECFPHFTIAGMNRLMADFFTPKGALPNMFQSRLLRAVLAMVLFTIALNAQDKPSVNIALTAKATASSESEGSKAEYLTDGDITNTQWSAKEGTSPADTWVELNWPKAAEFQEVVIRQSGDPQLSHVNLEIRDANGQWKLLQSIGNSQHLLPRLILAQFAAQNSSGLRLSGFAGRVSLMEVEVYDRTDQPVINIGSDLLNHIFGIVTDAFGTRPFSNAPVELQGTAGGKPWHASAQTDGEGIFQVEMPVGLEGDLTVTAQLAGSAVPKTTVHAFALTPGLGAPDDSAPMLNLDGTWSFKPDADPEASYPDSDWKDIKVPSHWTMEGFNTKTGMGAYRRHLQIPASFRGRRIKLLFDGVYSGARVFLNGKPVGSHEGGFSPFELDVTEAAHIGGDNLLAVLVEEKTLSSHLDNMSYYANFPLSGIFRHVQIFSVPETHVRRFHVQTVFDSAYRDATLTLDLSVENESGREVAGTPLVFSLKDPQGHSVSLENDRLDIKLSPWSRLEQRIGFHIPSPVHWEAEHPQLYTLSAKFSGSQSEIVSRRFGFRQIEIRGTQFLINGVPVKLRGANHYEMDPLAGRAVTPETHPQGFADDERGQPRCHPHFYLSGGRGFV